MNLTKKMKLDKNNLELSFTFKFAVGELVPCYGIVLKRELVINQSFNDYNVDKKIKSCYFENYIFENEDSEWSSYELNQIKSFVSL